MITREDFLTNIRTKYPSYDSMGDEELYEKITTKYPQYKEQIQTTPVQGMISTKDGAKPGKTPAMMSTPKGARQAQAPVIPEKKPEPVTFGDKFREITERRGQKVAGNRAQRQKGEITVGEEVGRDLGQGIATLGEVGVTGAISLLKKVPGLEGSAKFTVENQPALVKRAFSAGFDAIQRGVDAYTEWKESSPLNKRIAEDIEAVANIGAGVIGGQGAKGTATAVGKGGKKAMEALDAIKPEKGFTKPSFENIPGRMGDTVQKGVRNSMGKDYREIFNSTKPLSREYQSIKAKGKLDPVELLLDKKVFPEVTNGAYSTKEAVKSIEDDVSALVGIRRQMLQSSGEYVDLEDVRKAALRSANNDINRSQNLVKDVQKGINSEIDQYLETYGERIPVEILSDIKVGQRIQSQVYDRVSKFETRYANANHQIANTAMEMIEKKAGDDVMREFNKLIGQHYDAIKLLDGMEGNRVKGGLFRRNLATLTGGVVGGLGGGSVLSGLGGAVAGNYLISLLQHTGISNPLKQMILKRAASQEPKAYEEAMRYIRANNLEKEMRPLLNAPQSIQLPQKTQSSIDAGKNAKMEAPRAKKNPDGSFSSEAQDLEAQNAKMQSTTKPTGEDANTIPTNPPIEPTSKANAIDKSIAKGGKANQAFGVLGGMQPEYDENGNMTGFSFDPATAALGLGAMSVTQKKKLISQFFKKEPSAGALKEMRDFVKYYDFKELPGNESNADKWLADVRKYHERDFGFDAGMTDLTRARLYGEILEKADKPPKFKQNAKTGKMEGSKKSKSNKNKKV